MKILLLTLLSSLFNVYGSTNVNLALKSHSNIDYKKKAPAAVISQELALNSKFKFKPKKGLVFIDLPSLSTEFTPNQQTSIRNLYASNTLIGLYFLDKKNILIPTFTLGYSNSFSLNDENALTKNKKVYAGIDLSHNKIFSKKLDISYLIGTRIDDYQSKYDELGREEDYLKLYSSFELNAKPSKKNKLKVKLKAEKRLYKEKLALLSTGVEGGTRPETIQNYKLEINNKYHFKKHSFNYIFGHELNDDKDHGAKDYNGPFSSISFTLGYNKFIFSHKTKYSVRNYKNQQTDINSTTDKDKYQLKILQLKSEFILKNLLLSQYNVAIGHEMFKNISNRTSDESVNNIYKVSVELKF